jgi:HEAT repeat protein
MLVNARDRKRLATEAAEPDGGSADPARDLASGASAALRRLAAHDLRDRPDCAGLLCRRLGEEDDASVRAVILTSLIRLKSPEVAAELAPYLRSEDATLRSEVMEALQEMPDEIGPVLDRLLDDEDSDVRIFAANILGCLPHPRAPALLARAVARDPNVNVCMAALDGLMEVGDAGMIAAIAALPSRFPDQPFVQFAAAAALKRLKG